MEVLVYPLNSVVMIDNNYLDRNSHYLYIENLSHHLDEKCHIGKIKNLHENKKLDIIPYIYDFLNYMKDSKITLRLVALDEKEKEFIKYEMQVLNLSQYFEEKIILSQEIENLNKNNSYVLISERVEDFVNLKNKINIFSIFNFLIFDATDGYLKIQEQNVKLLKNTENYPNLVIESLKQANCFISHINQRLLADSQILKSQVLEEFFKNSLNVLYIFDSKSASKNYRKRELAITTEKVHYIPFMTKIFGQDPEFLIYPKFQVVLQRCPYFYFKNKQFCLDVQNYLDKKPKVLVLDHMRVIDICFNRSQVYTFLKEFVEEIKEECKDIKIDVPFSYKFELSDKVYNETSEESTILSEIKAKFFESISLNKMLFPLIIKPEACTSHDLFLILNENGISNFLNTDNLFKIKQWKTFLIQKFITHDGLMFKNYHINNKTVTIIRPSLPNLEGQNLKIKQFENGCFKFQNEFLYKKEDPTFWDKITPSEEAKINLEALDHISKLLAIKKNITLFGIDWLYDKTTETYYLLEINYFPSYRELKGKISIEFAEHIINLFNSFKK